MVDYIFEKKKPLTPLRNEVLAIKVTARTKTLIVQFAKENKLKTSTMLNQLLEQFIEERLIT